MDVRWKVLLALTLARTSMGFQFQLVPAQTPYYLDELGLSFTAFGTLAGAYLLPGTIAALSGGWLGVRIGDIRTALIGLVLMILGGLVLAVTDIFGALLAARLASGIGAVALNVMVTKMAGDWFEGQRDLPTAMGVLVSSWPAGIALAMLVAPALAAQWGASVAALSAPVFSAIALVLLARIWRAPGRDKSARSATNAPRLTRSELTLILFSGLIWAIYNVAFINVILWAPDVLTSRGTGQIEAAALTSIIGWSTMIAIPLGGWFAARMGHGDWIMMISFALSGALAVAFGLWGTGASAFATLLAFGLAFGPAAGLVVALPVEVTRADVRAFALGIYYAIYYVFLGIAPTVFGRLRDTTGEPAVTLVAAGLLFFLCVALLGLFRRAQNRSSAP